MSAALTLWADTAATAQNAEQLGGIGPAELVTEKTFTEVIETHQ